MPSKYVVGHIADPEFEPNGTVSFRQRTCKDISRSMLIMCLHYEFRYEFSRLIVVRNSYADFITATIKFVNCLKKEVASIHHLILLKSMVRNISIPTRLRAFCNFKETDCFKHDFVVLSFCKGI